ncbi:hypothetical protein B0H14DRAFT_2581118 [Mycena olivaceomarginata]|nr:hypothetical protein B0H14DRAFT_2581118 [Mycena olivaceomarginata]
MGSKSAIMLFVQRPSCLLKMLVLMVYTVDSELITILRGLPNLTHLVIEEDYNSPTRSDLGDLGPSLNPMSFSPWRDCVSDASSPPPSTQLRLFGGWQNRIKLCPLQTVVKIQKMCKEGFDVAFLGPREANVLQGQDFFLDFTISCRICYRLDVIHGKATIGSQTLGKLVIGQL